ncbi:YsnF/AvaK domain-containing protein [Brevundimonas sp. R86498]|uniref:YsnF/AvaK domain-containing protein n=1 Tax=Brevundimonas sp. R86498 TaxID=3093845 RepID=UPI0037C62125
MTRTITALFETRADAESARDKLCNANIDKSDIRIVDQSSSGAASHQELGFWASIKNAMLPDDDRQAYEEGIRRGGFLLTADVDEPSADRAITALESANAINLDERSAMWRQDGWKPGTGTTPLTVAEEKLVVGKREVDRGGTRLRSYVTEKPVHEQIALRKEQVGLERKPVDRKLAPGEADPFRERSIEMTATNEEAVVGKETRIIEEVGLKKTSEERVADVKDKVRQTRVTEERIGDRGASPSH